MSYTLVFSVPLTGCLLSRYWSISLDHKQIHAARPSDKDAEKVCLRLWCLTKLVTSAEAITDLRPEAEPALTWLNRLRLTQYIQALPSQVKCNIPCTSSLCCHFKQASHKSVLILHTMTFLTSFTILNLRLLSFLCSVRGAPSPPHCANVTQV